MIISDNRIEELWNMAGDEFSDVGGGRFGLAPCFYFHDGAGFGTLGVSHAVGRYGSASGFVSQ